MAAQNFGNRLAEARRRRGLTIEQVHNQLRITPAIIEALELGDFRHMPLKGHARNMVSSYARYLGLNPEDVTKQFLKEYHEYENREARQSSSPYSSLSMGTSLGMPAGAAKRGEPADPLRHKNSENNRNSRSMWDQPIPNSDIGRGYSSRPSTTRRMTSGNPEQRSRTREGAVASRYGAGSYTSRPSLPMRVIGALFKSPVALIVVLIVVLVALLALWAIAANSCKQQESVVVPPSTTRTTLNGNSTISADGVPIASQNGEITPLYGSFDLAVEPAAGTAPWVKVTVDGIDVFVDILTEKKSWEVNTNCTVTTAQPNNLKVYRNGDPVTLDINEDRMGTKTLEVLTRPANPSP